ncbi:MAG: type VI secretion protein IcmF/TssM N-terminal domain-containing protein [Planctomycetota bacterium]
MTAFLNLPMPVKAAILILSGGGIMYLLYALIGAPAVYVVYFIIGFVLMTLFGYRYILKRMDKGKSTPFLQRLRENSSAAPSAVNDPSARARLDDLRRKFEEGIQTFKDHGKDLYSVPWYALVGEPGSGKTEAIRHCNVGFPPGLQDQLQGAGGTLNMNWWFTNHAVILDTAGRLMFEEVAPGQTNEWKEFLRLLRQVRPNCPINGMLLVIPADSLIKDSANDIEQKGGKIAEQLDAIQRALGVRFPVFVIVTKSDLINGFREFFEGVSDPVLQHQMLGWSNPDPLDTPFRPEEVENHLKTVRERLIRRRMGLMVDPTVQGEDSSGRLDDVDSLYAVPEAIAKIGPRLRRYLEMVFVAGEWSQKPLFLRGIYFTSSMRQGEPLDADLADALGVEIGKLPEGGLIKPRDISYFLKDMFMDKVFRERGLVTRAANTNQIKRQRQLIAIGGAAALILLTAVLTWVGQGQLRGSIGDRQTFWADVDDQLSNGIKELVLLDELAGDARYEGNKTIELERSEQELTAAALQLEAYKQVEDKPSTPLVFQPVAMVTGNAFDKQESAQKTLFELCVIRPALDEVRRRLDEDESETGWTLDASAALAELLRLESAAAGKGSKLVALDERSPVELDALYRYALLATNEEGYNDFAEQHESDLQRVLDATYKDVGSSWPPSTVGAGTERSGDAARRGVNLFVRSWGASGGAREGTLFGDLVSVQEAATGFAASEERLRRLFQPGVGGAASADAESRRLWAREMAAIREHKATLDAGVVRLIEAAGRGGSAFPDEATLASRARESVLEDAGGQYAALLAALPPLDELDEDDDDERLLFDLRTRLEAGEAALGDAVDERVAEVQRGLAGIRGSLLDAPARSSTGQRGYEARFAAYDAVDGLMVESQTPLEATDGLAGLSADAASVERRIADASGLIERVRADGAGIVEFEIGAGVASRGLEFASRMLRGSVVSGSIAVVGDRDLAAWVAETASGLTPVQKPSVPRSRMDGGSFDAAYHPVPAKDVLDAYAALRVYGGSDSAQGILSDPVVARSYEELMTRCEAYMRAYTRYWLQDVIAEASFDAPLVWPEYLQAVNGFPAQAAMDELNRLGRALESAMEAVPVSVRDLTPGVNEFLGRIGEDQTRTRDRGYFDLAASSLRSMGGLPGSVPTARRALLSLRPLDVQQDFLAVYRDDALTPAEAYWSSVVLEGFRLLARGSRERVSEARQQLVDNAKGFPLCLDAEETLTAEELVQAVEHVELLAVGAGSGGTDGTRLGDGFYDGLPRGIVEEVRDIRGEGASLSRVDQEWIRKLAAVSTLFSGEDALEWELLVLGSSAHSDSFTAGRYRFMQARAGQQPVPIDGRPRTQTEFWVCQTDAVFEVPQPVPVRVAFSELATGEFLSFALFDETWGGLGVLAMPDAEPIDLRVHRDAPALCEGVWKFDVELVDANGARVLAGNAPVVYSFGVRFNAPIPDLADWPRVSDWP